MLVKFSSYWKTSGVCQDTFWRDNFEILKTFLKERATIQSVLVIPIINHYFQFVFAILAIWRQENRENHKNRKKSNFQLYNLIVFHGFRRVHMFKKIDEQNSEVNMYFTCILMLADCHKRIFWRPRVDFTKLFCQAKRCRRTAFGEKFAV